MIKEIYRLRLVLIIALVAVLMASVRFKYRNYDWSQTETKIVVTPTPSVVPTVTPSAEELYPLYNLLPYQGKDFVVNSYLAPFALNVVTTGNIKSVTKDIYKWMLENKVATESHKLIFSDK